MIILKHDGTNPQTIIASSAVSASDLTCLASYRVRSATTFEPDNKYSNITDTPAVIIVSAPPGSGYSHIIDSIIVSNKDGITHTVTIQWTSGTSFARIWRGTLLTNESVQYAEGSGWQKINAAGEPIIS